MELRSLPFRPRVPPLSLPFFLVLTLFFSGIFFFCLTSTLPPAPQPLSFRNPSSPGPPFLRGRKTLMCSIPRGRNFCSQFSRWLTASGASLLELFFLPFCRIPALFLDFLWDVRRCHVALTFLAEDEPPPLLLPTGKFSSPFFSLSRPATGPLQAFKRR